MKGLIFFPSLSV